MLYGPNSSRYVLSSGEPLRCTTEEKDLGVTIDSRPKFSNHMADKTAKANKGLGAIWRTFEHKDCDTLLSLYKSLVRLHLEYSYQVLAPHLVKDIEAIENVQRRATRMMPGLKGLSYEELLRKLRLPSLSYRRARGDAIEAYKILSGKYDREATHGILRLAEDTRTRGHSLMLLSYRCRPDVRKYSFPHRIVPLWISLPQNVIEAPSVHAFQSRLDKH